MTAEIAILNKTAVALAADSAVTISAGSNQQKIFDTADKLFELSCRDAIGIMINSDMNFMETPLPVLIKRYRVTAPQFEHVPDAATDFLDYLDKFAAASPERVKDQNLVAAVSPMLTIINDRSRKSFEEKVFEPDGTIRENLGSEDFGAIGTAVLDEQLAVVARRLEQLEDASFLTDDPLEFSEHHLAVLRAEVDRVLPAANDAQKDRAVELCETALRKPLSTTVTGMVVAGFGSDDLFPTLVSYDLFGVVCDRLKFRRTNSVDIDRDGTRAQVIPFAQSEMVERFLYGVDGEISKKVSEFCKQAVPQISQSVIGQLDMEDDDREKIMESAQEAEGIFFRNLEENAFDVIREGSRSEIEDMVEFMPKPEMGRMAEALVNLTSIKRRVSRGFETVGGPIDVAVISAAEGFVWVKRKHYFPGELNARYFERIRAAKEE